MVKRLLNRVLVILIFFAYSFGEDLNKYFKEEKSLSAEPSKILVLSKTYGEFNPIGGFADGRYKLVDYDLKKVKPNIYYLKLIFQKKKGSFRFTQEVEYYFWYDGQVIAFKTYKGKVRYFIPDKKIKIIKRGEGYVIEEEPVVMSFVLPAIGGKVYLYLLFR
ncbi:MAG: hypothetical protein DSY66_05825 [Persephonella sp.]|nr:MAG: hypothetical protein DSY66_05825 [Persephonella sp.]RUM59754.1 MAG: hypothetical protein DSY53_02020 [Persephonella sp.]